MDMSELGMLIRRRMLRKRVKDWLAGWLASWKWR
jgi:hypothetical protein